MSRALASPSQAMLNSVHKFQSNVSVRAAESAFIVVGLGGFYLVALLRILTPYGRGPTYVLLNSVPIGVHVALTVVGPFAVVVLEWLSALAELGRHPDVDSWSFDRKFRYLLETTTVTRTTASFVYLPLLPASVFWTAATIVHGKPYWPLPAVVCVLDLAVILAINKYIR